MIGPVVAVGHDDVEPVERAWDYFDLTSHAGGLQPFGVDDVLLVEQVEVTDTDPRRGKPSQMVAAGGHCDVALGATEI